MWTELCWIRRKRFSCLSRKPFTGKQKKTDIRDLKYALGIPSEAALRQYGFPEEEIPEIVDFWGDLTPDYRKFIKVFPGIRPLLEKLKENGARLG